MGMENVTLPIRLLAASDNRVSFVKLSILLGMPPVNLLKDKDKVWSSPHLLRLDGIGPVNWLTARRMPRNADNSWLHMLLGRSPDRLL